MMVIAQLTNQRFQRPVEALRRISVHAIEGSTSAYKAHMMAQTQIMLHMAFTDINCSCNEWTAYV